jgi:hypothetical protein
MFIVYNDAQYEDIIIHGRRITMYGNYISALMIITILENKC